MTAARPRHARRGSRSRSLAIVAAAALAATTALVAVPASAEPDASGDGWTVERVGDAYEVTVELDQPLETRAAAPTIVVDGAEVGTALVSPDGTTLTSTTADPGVLQADEIRVGWEGEAGLDDAAPLAVVAPSPADVTSATPFVEPAPEAVPYDVGTLDYDLGRTVPLRGIPGASGELAAHVTYPVDAPGPRPVVIAIHGRGPTCVTSRGVAVAGTPYPCVSGQTEVSAHRGFDQAAASLAERGFVVISIKTNAVASLDAAVVDRGATARAGQVLAHLDLLGEVEAGTAPTGAPTQLRGRLDLSSIGLLGHSRGGEAAVRTAQLAAVEGRAGIRSIMLLAPTNMGRTTLPDVPTYTLLPYCDGDVVTLQGQHYYEDSRYAFDDEVLRATGLLMGANHNFFNPALPGGELPPKPWSTEPVGWVGDDWDRQIYGGTPVDPTCSTNVPDSQRLPAPTQVDVLDTYASAWFRMTLGREGALLPMFDGSGGVPTDLLTAGVEIATVATAPATSRVDIARLTEPSHGVTAIGEARAQICASLPGAPAPSSLPTCADRPPSAAPHWAPTLNAASTAAGRMLHLTWTASGDGVRLTMPAPVDATSLTTLSLRATLAPESLSAPDVDLVLVDADGRTASVRASTRGTALQPLPGPVAPMAKTVLRTIAVPLGDLRGVDRTRITEVRVLGATASGAVLLSDVALSASAVGEVGTSPRVRLDVADVGVREGNGPGLALVPVRLTRAAVTPVTVSVESVTTAGADVRPTARTVTFAPGQTCVAVPVALVGNRAPSNVPRRSTVVSAVAVTGAVGGTTTSLLTVQEDDGRVPPPGQAPIPLPPESDADRRTDPCGRTSADLFVDVPVGSLHHEAMAWVGATGVTTGWVTPAGAEYRPVTPVNRDAMAAFLYRFAGSPKVVLPPDGSPFLDVRPDNIYYREIVWLSQQGISAGWPVTGGAEFRPLQPVNRDAMAAFLFRFAETEAYGPPASSPFADVRTNQEHFAAMAWLAEKGVSLGWDVGGALPQYRALQPVNRDAMAAFLERLTRIP